MDFSLLRHGRLIVAHPDSVPAIEALDPWEHHSKYLAVCRQLAAPAAGAPDLAETGYVPLPGLISAGDAQSISKTLADVLADQGGATGPTDPQEANVTAQADSRIAEMLRSFIPKLITDDIAAAVETALGANFRIDFASLYRSHPMPEKRVSFLWHRDMAPMSQVHLLVYLTGGRERGGTSYMSLADNRRAAARGYHFLPLGKRADSLDDVFGGEPSADVYTPDVAPGDAVLFSAPRILHRGILPTGAARDALLLVFQASPVPWRVEFEDIGVDHLVLPASKNTLHTNPFMPLHPNIAGEIGGVYELPPAWALNSQLTENDP